MIASLDGLVGAVFADCLILEVGGVGYRVFAAPSVLASTPVGGRTRLFTHHVIREDLQALYGFRTPEELGFFGLLLTVTGVGPKVALGIVGSRAVGDLQLAILSDDLSLLTAVPGVGKKLAARVVLELKEKVAAAGKEEAGRRAPPGVVGRIRRDAGPGPAPGGGAQGVRCRGMGWTGIARPGSVRGPGARRVGAGGWRSTAGAGGVPIGDCAGAGRGARRGAWRRAGGTRQEAPPQAPPPPRERERTGAGRGRRHVPDGGR